MGNAASRVAALFSQQRKFSVTDIIIPQSERTPIEVMTAINDIMLINTAAHRKINLATNPDHFVLQETAKNVQEVLEITGGSPLPTHFFAHYGDEEGLQSQLSEGFHVQAAGTARLADGTIVGGVRHQIKEEAAGLHFRALVEFPVLVPNTMIRQHQYHLACEFRGWLSAVL